MNQVYLVIKDNQEKIVKVVNLSTKKECQPGSKSTLTHTHKTTIG